MSSLGPRKKKENRLIGGCEKNVRKLEVGGGGSGGKRGREKKKGEGKRWKCVRRC